MRADQLYLNKGQYNGWNSRWECKQIAPVSYVAQKRVGFTSRTVFLRSRQACSHVACTVQYLAAHHRHYSKHVLLLSSRCLQYKQYPSFKLFPVFATSSKSTQQCPPSASPSSTRTSSALLDTVNGLQPALQSSEYRTQDVHLRSKAAQEAVEAGVLPPPGGGKISSSRDMGKPWSRSW